MTLPLALRFGGWTKKKDGMYLTETSCKLLVFLETKTEFVAYILFWHFCWNKQKLLSNQ